MNTSKGMVYIFTGDGKGKTSAALGVTLRMLLLDKRVEWISWFKEESWKTAEMKLPGVFTNNLKMHWTGKGFFGGPDDHHTLLGHKKAALAALLMARGIFSRNKGLGVTVELLVLDEVLTAIDAGLLNISDVTEVVKLRGKTQVVLTGNICPGEIEEMADLVTRMKKVKHPFDKGIAAVPGLDF